MYGINLNIIRNIGKRYLEVVVLLMKCIGIKIYMWFIIGIV